MSQISTLVFSVFSYLTVLNVFMNPPQKTLVLLYKLNKKHFKDKFNPE